MSCSCEKKIHRFRSFLSRNANSFLFSSQTCGLISWRPVRFCAVFYSWSWTLSVKNITNWVEIRLCVCEHTFATHNFFKRRFPIFAVFSFYKVIQRFVVEWILRVISKHRNHILALIDFRSYAYADQVPNVLMNYDANKNQIYLMHLCSFFLAFLI